jgi:sulfatase maturation enzyme AslB (radical SAM superfamily)
MELLDKICLNPFEFIEIHPNGDVFVCCPRWSNNYAIGNIFNAGNDAITEIWNSDRAQQFRSDILSGTFNCCNKLECPRIVAQRLPNRHENIAKKLSVKLDHGPSQIKFCHDNTCNLFCYSCRADMYYVSEAEQSKLESIVDKLKPFLKDAKILNLSGCGDPFASKHYRSIISSGVEFSDAKFSFHTNGVLFDRNAWDDLKLQNRVLEVNISIDAATEETYKIVRRGGDFSRLKRNLGFLKDMRKINQISHFTIGFVVQSDNFLEMPAFVELGKLFGVDSVYFSLIRDWGSIDDFKNAQVWNIEHPRHEEFLYTLSDMSLKDPIVNLGDVMPFVTD